MCHVALGYGALSSVILHLHQTITSFSFSSKKSSEAGQLAFVIFWDCVFHYYLSHLYVLAI